jgi:hypothetical protein
MSHGVAGGGKRWKLCALVGMFEVGDEGRGQGVWLLGQALPGATPEVTDSGCNHLSGVWPSSLR